MALFLTDEFIHSEIILSTGYVSDILMASEVGEVNKVQICPG